MIIPSKKTVVPGPVQGAAHETAVAEFIRNKGVTRCPTAVIVPTTGAQTSQADKEALRIYANKRNDVDKEQVKARQAPAARRSGEASRMYVDNMMSIIKKIPNHEKMSGKAIARILSADGHKSAKGSELSSGSVLWIIRYNPQPPKALS